MKLRIEEDISLQFVQFLFKLAFFTLKVQLAGYQSPCAALLIIDSIFRSACALQPQWIPEEIRILPKSTFLKHLLQLLCRTSQCGIGVSWCKHEALWATEEFDPGILEDCLCFIFSPRSLIAFARRSATCSWIDGSRGQVVRVFMKKTVIFWLWAELALSSAFVRALIPYRWRFAAGRDWCSSSWINPSQWISVDKSLGSASCASS